MKRTTFLALIAAVGLTATMMLAGCNRVTAGQVRRNMTPALDTTNATSGQARNEMARVVDHNTRGIWDDLRRAFLLDEPGSLHPYTIP